MTISNDNINSCASESPGVRLVATATLPSQFGMFQISIFISARDEKEHVALVSGDVSGQEGVPTRIHSECLTGDVLGSLRCDCRSQLERALTCIGALPCGILLYLRQEGRGIGLTNKVRAYALQEQGLDTIDANLALGFAADERRYDVAAEMLKVLGVRSIEIMTNNPDKIDQLACAGVRVVARRPHVVPAEAFSRVYLETKARRFGHWLVERAEPPSTARPNADDNLGCHPSEEPDEPSAG